MQTLEKAFECLKSAEEGSIDYEMYRNSLVKKFWDDSGTKRKIIKEEINSVLCIKKKLLILLHLKIFSGMPQNIP